MPLAASRILVVEDDPRIGDMIEEMIVDAGGRVVGPFASVTDALESMGELGGVDAAILDIGLVGEDSFPLAAAMKANAVPFVFVSGQERSTLPEQFGRSAFLPKPFTASDLVKALITCGALRR